MSKNYTRPNDPDHIDDPKDWLNSALIFGRALSLLLEPNTGIVVDLAGDAFNPAGESKKVIVINHGNMIMIDDYKQDIPEGTFCEIIFDDENN